MVYGLVAILVIAFTVNLFLKIYTVETVIEYEISNELPLKQVKSEYIKSSMKPFDYSSIQGDLSSLVIKDSQFKDCAEFL